MGSTRFGVYIAFAKTTTNRTGNQYKLAKGKGMS